ncbi:MAG TPA: WD40 repeat domain-containing serine/threonine protein kinase, partial [Gemmataceae bacterium]|nr:WD40 repeat domain-containing serine/threonine protein kinase [Gemmataceae bacterium]
MLQLLTCSKGHSWEAAADDGAAVGRAVCPVCGDAVELLPLIDLAPSPDAITASPEPILAQAPPLRDAAGMPVVPGFEILEEMGRTPLGVRLFKAKQVLVNRTILLKVVVARDDAGQVGWGALRGEAAALGKVSHPNIPPLLDAGERDRQLFYNAVEWVEGPTLAEHAVGKPVPWRSAIRLVEVLARAVYAAHEQGVVHRGLRLACIRLQPAPERTNRRNPAPVEPPFYLAGGRSRCLPKIGDFGVARRPVEGEPADLELYEDLPTGLSPEQAWGRAREIGPCSDIYALGAILYELLSGRPALRGRTPGETLDFIRGGEPPFLCGRVPGLSRDAAHICRKAMQRNPRNRYDSALAFADDLRALVENRPIRAAQKGAVSRLVLWMRRRPGAALLVLLCLLTPIAVLIAHHIGSGDASRAQADVDKANLAASAAASDRQGLQAMVADANKREQRSAYLLRIFQADREFQAGNVALERQLLTDCPAALRNWEWYYLHSRLGAADYLSLSGPDQAIQTIAYSSNGQYLAAASGSVPHNFGDPPAKWEVHIWQPTAPDQVKVLSDFAGPIHGIAFSPDGKRLATAATLDLVGHSGEIKEWDPVQGRPLATWKIDGTAPADLAYSTDSLHLVVIDDQ